MQIARIGNCNRKMRTQSIGIRTATTKTKWKKMHGRESANVTQMHSCVCSHLLVISSSPSEMLGSYVLSNTVSTSTMAIGEPEENPNKDRMKPSTHYYNCYILISERTKRCRFHVAAISMCSINCARKQTTATGEGISQRRRNAFCAYCVIEDRI